VANISVTLQHSHEVRPVAPRRNSELALDFSGAPLFAPTRPAVTFLTRRVGVFGLFLFRVLLLSHFLPPASCRCLSLGPCVAFSI